MMIRPSDAWVLSRVVAGLDVNGEVAGLPEPFGPMVEHLAGLPAKARPSVFGAMLFAYPDRDELVMAMASVRPEDPQPPSQAPMSGPPPVVMRSAKEITPMAVEWLWEPRLPLGMLSLFAGDPKLGKSFVTVALAAAVSRGAPLPLDAAIRQPASVIVMSAEDDPARTIVPRLTAAGADLARIHVLEAVRLNDGREAMPSLRSDIERIGDAAARLGDCRLLVIDPVSAYLGGTDDHKNGELRGVCQRTRQSVS